MTKSSKKEESVLITEKGDQQIFKDNDKENPLGILRYSAGETVSLPTDSVDLLVERGFVTRMGKASAKQSLSEADARELEALRAERRERDAQQTVGKTEEVAVVAETDTKKV